MTKRVFVTGIAGQVGRHLGRFLREHGYYVGGDDIVIPDVPCCDEFHQIDITAPRSELAKHLTDRQYDCVIHLAAIVAPTEEPDDKIINVNVWGTYNVVQAAREAGVGRFIYMSSEATLGYAFQLRKLELPYVPIDEGYPLRAHDPYGLSKLLAEQVCLSFHHATDATVFALRPPWIWIPEKLDRYEELVHRPETWAHGLWAYIVIDDLCMLVEKAVEIEARGFHSFFIAADDNGTSRPTLTLLRELRGFDGQVKEPFAGRESVISSAAACQFFDWRPRWSWHDWMAEERRRSGKEMIIR